MKKQIFTLLTLLVLCVTGAWATPTIWDFQKTYDSSNKESECEGDVNNWSALSSGQYTYQKTLSDEEIKNQTGDASLSLTAGLKFTVGTKKKLQLGKGYLCLNLSGASFSIPTAENQYVNLIVGNGNDNQAVNFTGADKTSVTLAAKAKAYIIKLKATGTSITVSYADSKFYIYRIELYDKGDAIAAPVPDIAEGSYYKGVSIALSASAGTTILCKQDAATKAYGLTDLTTYSSAISLSSSGNRKIWACAVKDGLHSEMVELAYTRVDDFPTPEATPAAGTYNTTQNVVLSAEGLLPNGVIRYTTDGSSPSNSSTEYTTPIAVSATTTIKAYVFDASGSNKGSMLTAAYTIVELTDPVFSLSATTIPSNETAQIKVGSNAGLDGVTLSNISYGTDGIVTVNSTTGVVTPVTTGTTTITFDTDATVKYNASTGNALTITVTQPKCADPTIEVSAFDWTNKKYVVTITNNEDGSTLKVSTDGVSYETQTSPYEVNVTSTTHFYAKAEKSGYDDSEVVEENVINDNTKPYIAWVCQSGGYTDSGVTYNFDDDKMVLALQEDYNVVKSEISSGTEITTEHDIKNADLIVLSEAVGGGSNLAMNMKNFIGVKPMINLKVWASTTATGRWGWGTAHNVDDSGVITPTTATYKILSGVTLTAGNINMFEGTTGRIQTITWSSAPTNNVNMGMNGTDVAMHAIIDDEKLDKQFFGMGVCCNYRTKYSANTVQIIKNVAAVLIAGTERLDATPAEPGNPTTEGETVTVPVSTNMAGWRSFIGEADQNYTVEAGTTVYYVSATNSSTNKVTLTEIIAGGVPANTPVILYKAGATSITLTKTATSIDAPGAANKLAVSTAAQDLSAGVYRLGFKTSDGVGFYKYTNASAPAGIIYISVLDSPANFLGFDFGDTTGIEKIEGATKKIDGEYYNLAGQRVAQPTKGLYIVNGKKVVLK